MCGVVVAQCWRVAWCTGSPTERNGMESHAYTTFSSLAATSFLTIQAATAGAPRPGGYGRMGRNGVAQHAAIGKMLAVYMRGRECISFLVSPSLATTAWHC